MASTAALISFFIDVFVQNFTFSMNERMTECINNFCLYDGGSLKYVNGHVLKIFHEITFSSLLTLLFLFFFFCVIFYLCYFFGVKLFITSLNLTVFSVKRFFSEGFLRPAFSILVISSIYFCPVEVKSTKIFCFETSFILFSNASYTERNILLKTRISMQLG